MSNVQERIDKLADTLSTSLKSVFTDILFDEKALKEKLEGNDTETEKKLQASAKFADTSSKLKRLFVDQDWAKQTGVTMEDAIRDLKDTISLEEWRQLIPVTMSQIVTEAAEPEFIGARLLQKINVDPALKIEYPIFGQIADAEEVGASQEYPVRKMGVSAQGIARMGKFGIRLEIQDEVLRYITGWDIYGIMLRACGKAMGRAKEKRIFAHIGSIGTTYFDNLDSNYLNTSGVNTSGAQNGTFTLDDLVEMAGDLINAGFTPDTILINGLAWQIFARVPELKEFALANGSGPFFQPGPTGGAGSNVHPASKRDPMLHYWSQAPALATMFTNPQSNIIGRPFTTAVTPYMSYTAASGTTPALTNIVVADSRYLGALLQEEEIQTMEFDDPRIDVKSVKFSERYAIASLAEGLGVRIARNVAIQRGINPFSQLQFTLASSNVTFPGAKTALSL